MFSLYTVCKWHLTSSTTVYSHMISYMFVPTQEENTLTIILYLDITSCSRPIVPKRSSRDKILIHYVYFVFASSFVCPTLIGPTLHSGILFNSCLSYFKCSFNNTTLCQRGNHHWPNVGPKICDQMQANIALFTVHLKQKKFYSRGV